MPLNVNIINLRAKKYENLKTLKSLYVALIKTRYQLASYNISDDFMLGII